MTLFFVQLQGELRKLFARKRTYLGFGAFLVIELLILGLLQLPKSRRALRHHIEGHGFAFNEYFSGLTLAHQMVAWTIFLLGSLYLALVAGDVIAKEVEEGTLRMILCRPVSRLRLLALKYLACAIYTFTLIGFIGGTSIAAGIIWKGTGGLAVIAPMDGIFAWFDFWTGLARFAGGLFVLSLFIMTITTLGFAFSCFNMKPAAATILTLSYFFLDMIFKGIPYFESFRGWFLTSHISHWMEVFRDRVPYSLLVEDAAYLFAVNATLLIAAAAAFSQRDFKS